MTLKEKNILIFGYGFGYHVREIISFLRKKNTKIQNICYRKKQAST